jgi:hypothetical protein
MHRSLLGSSWEHQIALENSTQSMAQPLHRGCAIPGSQLPSRASQACCRSIPKLPRTGDATTWRLAGHLSK